MSNEYEGQIIVDNEICVFPFPENGFSIEYDSLYDIWRAVYEDSEKYDYEIIIEGEIELDNGEKVIGYYEKNMELFDGFILTESLWEELKGYIYK